MQSEDTIEIRGVTVMRQTDGELLGWLDEHGSA